MPPSLTDRVPPPQGSTEVEMALFLLKDYLEHQKHLASRGITLEQVYNAISDLGLRLRNLRDSVDTVVKEQIAQGMRLERTNRKVREMRDVVNKMNGHDEDELEDTGSFRVEDTKRAWELSELKRKVEQSEAERLEERREEKENSTWWTRQRTLWIGIVAMSLISAILSGCVGVGVYYLTKSGK